MATLVLGVGLTIGLAIATMALSYATAIHQVRALADLAALAVAQAATSSSNDTCVIAHDKAAAAQMRVESCEIHRAGIEVVVAVEMGRDLWWGSAISSVSFAGNPLDR